MKTSWAVLILGLICAVAACSLSNSGDDDDDDSDDDASDDDTDSDDDDDIPSGGVDLSGNWDCYIIDNNTQAWRHYEEPISFNNCKFYGCAVVCGDAGALEIKSPASFDGETLTIAENMKRCTRIN